MHETTWGRYRTSGPTHGLLIVELIVYPPGITTGERRAVELDRLAPVLGAAVGLVVGVLTFDSLPRWTLPVILLVCVIGSTGAARRLTAGVRGRIRSIAVTQSLLGESPRVTGDATLLEQCHAALRQLDAESHRMSRVEYERRWGDVYYRMPAGSGPVHLHGTERAW